MSCLFAYLGCGGMVEVADVSVSASGVLHGIPVSMGADR